MTIENVGSSKMRFLYVYFLYVYIVLRWLRTMQPGYSQAHPACFYYLFSSHEYCDDSKSTEESNSHPQVETGYAVFS